MSAPTDEERTQFLADLAAVTTSPPLALSLFDEHCDIFRPAPTDKSRDPLPTLPNAVTSLKNDMSQNDIIALLKPSSTEIERLESLTKKQANCSLWRSQRVGRITASVLHRVLHTKPENPAPSLMKSILSESSQHTAAESLKWGRDHEQTAIDQYSEIKSQHHTNFTIESAGMKIHPDHPYIAASPDAVRKCDCHGPAIVEVKCPISFKTDTFEEACSIKNFYCTSQGLKSSHQYFTQVQCQMYVWEKDSCDFIVWTPKWITVECIERDDSFISSFISKCTNFFFNHIVPNIGKDPVVSKLPTQRNVSKVPVLKDVSNTQQNNRIYCICQKPMDTEQYIGCDGGECKIEWFHVACVGLKRVPKGNWYCKTCKTQMKVKK